MIATISPATLADLRRRGERLTLIDVRTPAEYGEVHVDFARNVPLDRLDPQEIAAMSGHGPIYFVCKSGGRSQKACEKMLAAGIKDVISVDGGTAACEAAGVPVVRGQKAMSLERQVRIAAGALVAIGAALAAFGPDSTWQRIGAGLAGFVGCGLVFAGVTDTCGMAMLLARMPWNQACRSAGSCCAKAIMIGLLLGGLGDELADMLYDSITNKLVTLPDATLVYPAHGAGSMCGKSLSKETVSTIGEQKKFNYALQPMSREDFKRIVTADQPEAPEYFVHDAILNRKERASLAEAMQKTLKSLPLDEVLALQKSARADTAPPSPSA